VIPTYVTRGILERKSFKALVWADVNVTPNEGMADDEDYLINNWPYGSKPYNPSHQDE